MFMITENVPSKPEFYILVLRKFDIEAFAFRVIIQCIGSRNQPKSAYTLEINLAGVSSD